MTATNIAARFAASCRLYGPDLQFIVVVAFLVQLYNIVNPLHVYYDVVWSRSLILLSNLCTGWHRLLWDRVWRTDEHCTKQYRAKPIPMCRV